NSSDSCDHALYPPREDFFAFLLCSEHFIDFLSLWSKTIFLGAVLLALGAMLVLRNGGQRARQIMAIGVFLLGLLLVISLENGIRLALLAVAVPAFSVAAVHKRSLWLGVVAVTIVLFACLASWGSVPSYDWEKGEPFSLFDGVSIWPTEIIRFLVGLFCVYCLLRSWDHVNSNTKELSAKYKDDFELSNEWHAVTDWKQVLWVSSAGELKKATDFSELWRFYVRQGSGSYRSVRIIRGIACLFLLAFFLQGFFGRPFVPYRGDFSYYVDRTVILLSGFSLVVLMYFVIDAVNLCTTFVQELTRLRYGSQATADRPVDAWTSIRLIGDRTSAIGNLIYCPFVELFLLIASRLFYFDAWDFPLSLIIVLVVWLPSQLVVAALLLRRAAREARSAALAQLGDKLWKAEQRMADEIKQTTSRIESNQQGAFVPMSRDPVVSFILPSGSLAVLAFLEYMVGIF
ncbi:MAG TPA: hypothetical protein VLJ79_23045, partial [Candidatus Binatia bacterium]|nr:hypothetical protein [Candidatus Binatia bacterium]